MGLKKLAKNLAKGNDLDVEKELKLLKLRQKDIELGDYFTAFVMDRIRIDEFNAREKYLWEKENNKLKEGNKNED